MRCQVRLQGVFPAAVAPRELEVELGDEPCVADLVAVLRRDFPELVGPVIDADEDKLMSRYLFSLNGRLCLDEYDRRVDNADRVILLSMPLGG